MAPMKEMNDRERILVVDDDQGLLQLLTMRLTAMGFAVTPCSSGEEAIAAGRREMFELAITDLRLPDVDGLTVMQELRTNHSTIPVIILTAHGSIPNAVEAMQKGAFGYLTKPFDDKELKVYIEKALGEQRMSREIQRLQSLVRELYGMDNVIAKSHAMQVLLQEVRQGVRDSRDRMPM